MCALCNKKKLCIIYFHWFNRHVGLHIHILSHHKTISYALIYSAKCVLIVISEQTTNIGSTERRRGAGADEPPRARAAPPRTFISSVLATINNTINLNITYRHFQCETYFLSFNYLKFKYIHARIKYYLLIILLE